MAKASDFIQHGEGIFGLSASGNYTDEFGALISSVNYSWSAKGDAELSGPNGVMVGKTIYDSRCEITWEAYRKKTGTAIPHIGEVVDVNAEVLNLCIKNAGEEIPDTVTKAICTGIDVKMESAGYMTFTVKAMYSPNIAALNPGVAAE